MESSTISTRLRELIAEKGVTSYEVSKMTGISQATLSRILNNNTAKLNIQNLILLSDYFNVNYDWLSTGKGERTDINYGRYIPRTSKASDVVAPYYTNDPLIESHNRLAKAMETVAESNRILAENNRRVAESNEKVVNEMLRTFATGRNRR